MNHASAYPAKQPVNAVLRDGDAIITHMPTSQREKYGTCPLCRRECDLTFHHLIPRKLHRRTYFRKHFTKDALHRGINICRPCHNGIHRLYDEMQLAKCFSSLQALQDDVAVQRHCGWVARQKVIPAYRRQV